MQRYLVLGEETHTAHCPDWYNVLVAAKYLGVAPWELLEQSVYWRDKALIARAAEYKAQEIIESMRKH